MFLPLNEGGKERTRERLQVSMKLNREPIISARPCKRLSFSSDIIKATNRLWNAHFLQLNTKTHESPNLLRFNFVQTCKKTSKYVFIFDSDKTSAVVEGVNGTRALERAELRVSAKTTARTSCPAAL